MAMKRFGIIALALFAAACGQGASEKAPEAPAAAQVHPVTVAIFPGTMGAFEARPGNAVRLVRDSSGAVTSAIISSSVRGNQATGDGNSVYVRIPPQLREAAGGKAVTFTISSRTVPSGSAPTFYAAYTRPGSTTSSGWQEFRPTAAFTTQTMTYTLPPNPPSAQMDDLFVVYADVEGKGRGVEINSISASYNAP